MVETWTSWYPDYALTMYVVCKLILLLLFDYDKLDSIHFIWLWQAGFHSFFSDYGQLDSTPLVWLWQAGFHSFCQTMTSRIPLLLSDYGKLDSTSLVQLLELGTILIVAGKECCTESKLLLTNTGLEQSFAVCWQR